MAIREVLAKLGIEVDDSPLSSFTGKLEGAKKGILGLAAAMGLAKINSWLQETSMASFQLEAMAVRTGSTTKEIQKLGYMLQLSGGNASDAEKILFELNQQMTNATGSGYYFAESLRRLGIAQKDVNGRNRTATEILPDLAKVLDKASTEAQRTQIVLRVFGQQGLESLRPLLKRGSAGIAELAGEFEKLNLEVSKETVQANTELSREFQKSGLAAKTMAATLLGALAPTLKGILKSVISVQAKFLDWAKHTTTLTTALIVLKVAMASYAMAQARQMLPGLWKAIKGFVQLRTTVLGASVPLWAVVAVIAALYLVFDDLYALMTGNNSLIGELLDKYGGVGAKAKMVEVLRTAWEQMKKTWEGVKAPLKALWDLLSEGATAIGPALSKAFIGVVKAIVAAITALGGLADAGSKAIQGDWAGASKSMDKWGDSIFGKRNSYWDPKTNQMVSENVGGIFGKSETEYKAQMDSAYGKTPPPVTVNSPVNVKIDATNLPPDQAVAAVKGGTAKGVSTAVDDAFGGVATFAPGGVK